jgi:hypothetical protein
MPHEFKDDTLDDIAKRDIENLEVFLKQMGRMETSFDSAHKAHAFQGVQLCAILKKLGIDVPRAAIDKAYDIDDRMKQANIKVESRVYADNKDDEWRSGMYVYKDNEIAGFVGFPTFNETIFMGYKILHTDRI